MKLASFSRSMQAVSRVLYPKTEISLRRQRLMKIVFRLLNFEMIFLRDSIRHQNTSLTVQVVYRTSSPIPPSLKAW